MEGTWAPVKEPTRIAWYFNGNYPWVGMLFCAPIIGLWYWCTDQYIVQRTLIAPEQTEARRGTIFAAFLKLLPVFIFIIPGMIAIALAKSGKARAGALVDADGQTIMPRRPGGVSADGAACAAGRGARHGCGRSACGIDELAGRRVQRVLHPVHHGLLPEVQAECDPVPAGVDRAAWPRL